MIKVCDAQMGTGKTMACITYMNEHPDEKYIYITPYLSETQRIKDACPSLKFVMPNHYDTGDHSKLSHTAELVKAGRNIATSHQAFKYYTKDMLKMIREKGYVLFIDESVDILEKFSTKPDDINILMKAGYIEFDGTKFKLLDDQYDGEFLTPMFKLLRSRDLIVMPGDEKFSQLFYWMLTPDLITSFKDVYILTYLFSGQPIHHFLEMYHLPYKYIGVQKRDDGTFDLGEAPGYIPDYVRHIKDKLHIVDSPRMNRIGKGHYDLSMNWFKRHIQAQSDELAQLKRNVNNFFFNMEKGGRAGDRLWASFLDAYRDIKTGTRGISSSFLSFNARAMNGYRDRTKLAYLANVFMNATEKNFYVSHGIDVDEDMYALSILVQWIWRSAIRDGEEVTLYIPSSRMRGLLLAWMDSLEGGGDVSESTM